MNTVHNYGTPTIAGLIALVATICVYFLGCGNLVENGKSPENQKMNALNKAGRSEARLELSWAKDDVAKLILVNDGTKAITIDRDMVIGFDISIEDRTGRSVVVFASEHDIDDKSRRLAPARIVEVKPGQSLSRIIDTKDGFMTFRTAVGSDEQSLPIKVTALETLRKVSPDSRPAIVRIIYGISSTTDAGFSEYFGTTVSDVGLYTGDFKAELKYPIK